MKRVINFFKSLERDPNIVPIRSWRISLMIFILLGALLILMTPLFSRLSLPDFTNEEIIIPEFQRSIAFEWAHFLGGVILGYMFSHPAVGLTFGILKELTDWIRFAYTDGHQGVQSVFKSFLDIGFWAAGGFIGYYGLANLHYLLKQRDIRGLKDLTVFTFKKVVNNKNGNGNNKKSNHNIIDLRP